MARKYTRDNRGRFASGGGGATARGGRLRTASGNKRKTQTMKAQGQSGAGVMKGKVKRDAGAMAKRTPAAPKTTGRSRSEAGAAQKARNRRMADWAEFSTSLNPRVTRNSRVTEEGRYAETVGRPVIARRKYSQPNIFGGTDKVAGSKRAKLVGIRERGSSEVVPLAARALPLKGRGRPKPRAYGSR